VAGVQAQAAAEQAAGRLGAVHAAADAAQRRFEGQLRAAEVAAGEERREMLAVAGDLHTRMQVGPDASSASMSADPCTRRPQSQAQCGVFSQVGVCPLSQAHHC
jgi:hypothetical protein